MNFIKNKPRTIIHPNNFYLSGTVTKLNRATRFGDRFKSSVMGKVDWHRTEEEAEATVLAILHQEYRSKNNYSALAFG